MKSNINFLFCVALICSAYGCSQQSDNQVSEVIVDGHTMYAVSLNNLKPDTKTVPLSSLVENCELIQLETNDDAFVNPWFTTITEKYIGASQENFGPFMLFDRSGKFLCKVGAIGQGPGEYTSGVYDAMIDDRNELIYLSFYMSNKILIYNTSGQFVKEIVAPISLVKSKIFLSEDTLTVVHMSFSNNNAMAYQFDINTGTVLKEVAPVEHLIVGSFDYDIINTRNAPGIFDFSFMNCDTLYHYDLNDNKMLPVFNMTYSSSEKPLMFYFQINNELLFTNVLFLGIDPSTERQRYIPRGLVATDLKNKTSSYITIVNDYYGNMPVQVSFFTFFHGHYVFNVQPEQLIEEIETRFAQSSCTEKDKQILNQTLSTLKANENNVVFIGKLKTDINAKLW